MAFISMFFVFIVITIIVVCVSTAIAIGLFIASAVMKRKHLSKIKNAEMVGDYNYTEKKTYIIPKVFGFICLVPLVFCVGVLLYAVIALRIEQNTSLYYNVMNLNTEQIQKIIDSGVSPDCTRESNDPAIDGEKTLLYSLADGILYDQNHLDGETDEYIHDKTLEMMKLLIENGADVNCVVYYDDKNDPGHFYDDEYCIYQQTDKCGWTPLMEATYSADLDMIKLLVENGADVHAVDYCGYNMIDIVADYLDDEDGYEILEYYLDKGVDPNHVTNFNQDALWLAMRQQSGNMPLENDKILMTLKELNDA